jgi:hypothetical protein
MSESLEQRVAQLEKLLSIANEEIERLKDRREDLDMVTEKADQLENTMFVQIDKHRILANKVQAIDEEHARMFLISERIAQQSDMHSLQYSTVEEGMCHMLKCMRRHDENIRTVNDNAANLRRSLVKRIEDHVHETAAALEKMEEKTDKLDTICFNLRNLEQEIQTMKIRETETIKLVNTQPKRQKKWKQCEKQCDLCEKQCDFKFHDEFPSL